MKETKTSTPRVLVLTIARDVGPYLFHYFEALDALDYPRKSLSFGFLEGDSRDDSVEQLKAFVATAQARHQRAALINYDTNFDMQGPRWQPAMQRARRGLLAMLRNKLLAACLHDEEWVLWIDADVINFPPQILKRLLACKRKIITPNCVRESGGRSFDLNTFRRSGWWPLNERRYLSDGIIQPPEGAGRLYLHDMRGRRLVRVDGVGGTMLLVEANLHRRGLRFPTESYKGYIETEGLAVMARDMGVSSWAVPDLEIIHAAR